MLGFVMAVIWKVVKSDVVMFVLEPAFYYLFIQSLEQQFDYLFKCAGVKLISIVLGFKRAPHHNHYH